MSYGQNLPWGLKPTKSLGAAAWNSQTNPYLIRSGYANNIFKGDPVMIAGTASTNPDDQGYLISIYDAIGTHVFVDVPTVGIFNGCSFVTPTATNPIDPASPGRPFWPAGTVTLNKIPAVADVVDDPNTIFDVQCNLGTVTGVEQKQVGAAFNYVIPQTADIVQGNTNTGQSLVAINNAQRGAGTDTKNVICLRIIPSPPNPATAGAPFNNVEVLIQNHQYVRRAVARI